MKKYLQPSKIIFLLVGIFVLSIKVVEAQPNISLWRVDEAHLQNHHEGETYSFACGAEYYITYAGAGTYEDIHFAILNEGDQPLILSSPLTLSNASGSEFEIITQPNKTTLQANEETHFTIRYNAPNAYTNAEVSVRVLSNDADSPNCPINLDVGGGEPTSTTLAASNISTNGATLNGTTQPAGTTTTVTFEYGTTIAYGTTVAADQSPLNGSTVLPVSKAITGLTPNTTYHFRTVSVNGSGTSFGQDMTFTTLEITSIGEDFSVDDPCGCTDPENTSVNGVFLFHDVLTVSGTAGQTVEVIAPNDGKFLAKTGTNISLPITIPETSTGVYQLDFWHRSGESTTVNVTMNGGSSQSFTSSLCNEQACKVIPTLSQWGLMIFGLLILNLSVFFVRRRELV